MALPTKSVRYALAVLTLTSLLVLAIAGSYVLSLHAISRSQHQWCDTLALITSRAAQPPPAHADPTSQTARAYHFYVGLVKLRRDFGCDPR